MRGISQLAGCKIACYSISSARQSAWFAAMPWPLPQFSSVPWPATPRCRPPGPLGPPTSSQGITGPGDSGKAQVFSMPESIQVRNSSCKPPPTGRSRHPRAPSLRPVSGVWPPSQVLLAKRQSPPDPSAVAKHLHFDLFVCLRHLPRRRRPVSPRPSLLHRVRRLEAVGVAAVCIRPSSAGWLDTIFARYALRAALAGGQCLFPACGMCSRVLCGKRGCRRPCLYMPLMC